MKEEDKKYLIEQVTYLMQMKGQTAAQSYELTAWANIINRVLAIPAPVAKRPKKLN